MLLHSEVNSDELSWEFKQMSHIHICGSRTSLFQIFFYALIG